MPTLPPADPLHLGAAFLAALLAAAINSVAGGGTLISFPILVWLGLPSIMANATSTVGLWPGSLGSIWGFRRELGRPERRLRLLAWPCLAGGAAGAVLLRATSVATFDRIVPFLVLFATGLFAARGVVQRWLLRRQKAGAVGGGRALGPLLTLAVGVYGGYFGAGMSIMNLSVLGVLGLTDLLEMNALTSLYSLAVNGAAIALFAAAGLVRWPVALAMAAGALLGGYGAAGVARRVGGRILGRFVVAVGLSVSAIFFLRAM
ncbi:MAG TPA: sulfite exporter TauE/SafE family protein [Anaeromyxobacter sp.]|nr:sulfite exporter TauE/SafE family protein [Anaeromyxobacter sp.]